MHAFLDIRRRDIAEFLKNSSAGQLKLAVAGIPARCLCPWLHAISTPCPCKGRQNLLPSHAIGQDTMFKFFQRYDNYIHGTLLYLFAPYLRCLSMAVGVLQTVSVPELPSPIGETAPG